MKSPNDVDHILERSLQPRIDGSKALEYWRQDELLVLDDALPAALLAEVQDEVLALRARVKRKSVWGYKAAGSLAHGVLAEHAPRTLALYRSQTLATCLSRLADQPLRVCPNDDPHACAVYWYDAPGDRVGFHYDVSLYRGARYTLLLGLVDDSSARLQCRVHARDKERPTRELEIKTSPGKLVFFNGAKLLHAVSPLGPGEQRIVLSMQLVTDARMGLPQRALSTVKDAFTYFGLDSFKIPAKASI